jgi:hypothetical protein
MTVFDPAHRGGGVHALQGGLDRLEAGGPRSDRRFSGNQGIGLNCRSRATDYEVMSSSEHILAAVTHFAVPFALSITLILVVARP